MLSKEKGNIKVSFPYTARMEEERRKESFRLTISLSYHADGNKSRALGTLRNNGRIYLSNWTRQMVLLQPAATSRNQLFPSNLTASAQWKSITEEAMKEEASMILPSMTLSWTQDSKTCWCIFSKTNSFHREEYDEAGETAPQAWPVPVGIALHLWHTTETD